MKRRGGRRTMKRRGGMGKKGYSHPKKGQRSRTRKGRKAFVTHKGDKYYNRRRHRQRGKHGRKPYSKRRKTRKRRKRRRRR